MTAPGTIEDCARVAGCARAGMSRLLVDRRVVLPCAGGIEAADQRISAGIVMAVEVDGDCGVDRAVVFVGGELGTDPVVPERRAIGGERGAVGACPVVDGRSYDGRGLDRP